METDWDDFFGFVPEAELDFHQFNQLTHYDIEKILSEFLEESYVNKVGRVIVITGKGKVVRPLVNKLLAKSKFVKKYKQAGYFNGQSGAFEVTIK